MRKHAFEDGDVVKVDGAVGIYSGDDWLGLAAPEGRVWVVIDGDVAAVDPAEISKFGGRVSNWRMVDDEFNQEHHPDLVGMVFDYPIPYAKVEKTDDPVTHTLNPGRSLEERGPFPVEGSRKVSVNVGDKFVFPRNFAGYVQWSGQPVRVTNESMDGSQVALVLEEQWPEGSQMGTGIWVNRDELDQVLSTQASRRNAMRTEAEIVRDLERAGGLQEQRELVRELEQFRAARTAAIEADSSIDIANAFIRDTLTPVLPYQHHTAATDWIDEEVVSGPYDHTMRVEATMWFRRVSAEVKADRDEFGEQAQGMARRVSGQFGLQAEAAYHAFLETVARLHKQGESSGSQPPSDCSNCGGQREWSGEGEATCMFCGMTTKASRRTADDKPGKVDEDQSGNAESQITDYDTKDDQDPFLAEDWEEDEHSGVHPPMPGAGEGDRPNEPRPEKTEGRRRRAGNNEPRGGTGADTCAYGEHTWKGGYCSICGAKKNPSLGRRRTAAEGQTCDVCGDSIEKDPAHEDPQTWHHNNGEKHDHEAKPSSGEGESKESRRRTAATCSCAHYNDGSVGTMMCPLHADQDPCYTMAQVTGRRRSGSIVNGVCTNCGWTLGVHQSNRKTAAITYRTDPMTGNIWAFSPDNTTALLWNSSTQGVTFVMNPLSPGGSFVTMENPDYGYAADGKNFKDLAGRFYSPSSSEASRKTAQQRYRLEFGSERDAYWVGYNIGTSDDGRYFDSKQEAIDAIVRHFEEGGGGDLGGPIRVVPESTPTYQRYQPGRPGDYIGEGGWRGPGMSDWGFTLRGSGPGKGRGGQAAPIRGGRKTAAWGEGNALVCDGWCGGKNPVAMIDTAGFIYCEPCGMRRRQYEPCRKLRPHELAKLQRGEALRTYVRNKRTAGVYNDPTPITDDPCPTCGGPTQSWSDNSQGITVNFACDNPGCPAGKGPWDTPRPTTASRRKTAGVYCKTHDVWVGDGNADTHEGCEKEQRATEKTKESRRRTAVSDTCTQCGKQIHREDGVWVDNSGGDVCGVLGGNEPHVPSYPDSRDARRRTAADQEGPIGDGPNGYVAFYKGRQVAVYSDTSYHAQQAAAEYFKAKNSYEVDVVLATKDGEQVVHDPSILGSRREAKDITQADIDAGVDPVDLVPGNSILGNQIVGTSDSWVWLDPDATFGIPQGGMKGVNIRGLTDPSSRITEQGSRKTAQDPGDVPPGICEECGVQPATTTHDGFDVCQWCEQGRIAEGLGWSWEDMDEEQRAAMTPPHEAKTGAATKTAGPPWFYDDSGNHYCDFCMREMNEPGATGPDLNVEGVSTAVGHIGIIWACERHKEDAIARAAERGASKTAAEEDGPEDPEPLWTDDASYITYQGDPTSSDAEHELTDLIEEDRAREASLEGVNLWELM